MKPLVSALILAATLPLTATAAEFDAATAINQVGLDLYRQLSTKDSTGNLVISPYSIESALALVYAGADGTTRSEMARALHFPAENTALAPAFGALRAALDGIAQQSKAAAERAAKYGGKIDIIEWNAANRLFGQNGYEFRPAFLKLMREDFAAPFEPLDFIHNTEPSRGTINAWVEEQTRRKIRD